MSSLRAVGFKAMDFCGGLKTYITTLVLCIYLCSNSMLQCVLSYYNNDSIAVILYRIYYDIL